MPTRRELETALKNAHKAGDKQSAKKLANAIKAGQFNEPAPQRSSSLADVGSEYVSSVNRSIAALPDFFIDAGNYALNALNPIIPGEQAPQIPRVQNTLSDLTGGRFGATGYMEPGTARDVVQAAGEWTPALAGLRAPQAIKTTQNLVDDIAKPAARPKVVEEIQAIKRGDTSAARKTLSAAGQPVKNPAAKRAISRGVDEGIVAAVNTSNKQDRAQLQRMVKTLEQIKRNKLEGVDLRPADALGESFAQRITHLKGVNKRAGKAIDEAAQSLKGQVFDPRSAVSSFLDDLQKMGVSIDDDFKPVFEGSDIEKVRGASQRVIRDALDLIKGGRLRDPYRAHQMKRQLDEMIDYGKKSPTGLSGSTQRVIKNLRAQINESLSNQFPSYGAANKDFSTTRQVLDAFQEAAGPNFDFEAPGAAKQIGTLSRRLMGNYQTRQKVMNAFEDIDSVYRRYGGTRNDNIKLQALFADELDRVFGPVARTSFAGDIAKSVAQGGMRGGAQSIIERGVEKAFSPSEEQILQALKELVN